MSGVKSGPDPPWYLPATHAVKYVKAANAIVAGERGTDQIRPGCQVRCGKVAHMTRCCARKVYASTGAADATLHGYPSQTVQRLYMRCVLPHDHASHEFASHSGQQVSK